MQRKRQSLTKPAVTPTQGAIVVEQPSELFVAVEVTGSTSYIQNNFSQKAVEEMLRKHMGHSVQKTPKKPSEVLERATIRNVDGHVSIPPVAFKSAMVSAASNMKALKKTALRTGLFVEGASLPIRFAEMVPRMDMVRTSGMARTPDVRFRPSFVGWTARMVIRFADTFSHQSVIDLLNRAGRVGVGEWRPEKNGTHGQFSVTRAIEKRAELEEIRAACAVALVPLVIPEWALNLEIDPETLAAMFGDQGEEVAS